MRRLFAVLLSGLLVFGFAPVAKAEISDLHGGLTPCSESARFQERASAASTPQAIERFERYSKAVCGDDGLPHLIVPATIEPFGANVFRGHEGDVLIPGHIFLYVAGIIGWSGREYLKLARASKNPAENEIFLDPDFLRAALAKGAMWPLEADKEARSGRLRESNSKITTSPESDFSKVSF
ncbi:Photosystem I reaction center subunit III [Prochlorococcus sp. MIT 1341]|uniref:Photosystem I reaction center subunit III n=1 Tax=Prochlorococcus sp. MIT 1341 TaxID=3096221 RepID=UPI002A754AF5|nr:Photosystem I reaction center subunit III [Prochlorococcus sp. MIT 1341]